MDSIFTLFSSFFTSLYPPRTRFFRIYSTNVFLHIFHQTTALSEITEKPLLHSHTTHTFTSLHTIEYIFHLIKKNTPWPCKQYAYSSVHAYSPSTALHYLYLSRTRTRLYSLIWNGGIPKIHTGNSALIWCVVKLVYIFIYIYDYVGVCVCVLCGVLCLKVCDIDVVDDVDDDDEIVEVCCCCCVCNTLTNPNTNALIWAYKAHSIHTQPNSIDFTTSLFSTHNALLSPSLSRWLWTYNLDGVAFLIRSAPQSLVR